MSSSKKRKKSDPPSPKLSKTNRAGGIIFNQDFNEVLLIKGRIHQKWGLPKGHLEATESPLKFAVFPG